MERLLRLNGFHAQRGGVPVSQDTGTIVALKIHLNGQTTRPYERRETLHGVGPSNPTS